MSENRPPENPSDPTADSYDPAAGAGAGSSRPAGATPWGAPPPGAQGQQGQQEQGRHGSQTWQNRGGEQVGSPQQGASSVWAAPQSGRGQGGYQQQPGGFGGYGQQAPYQGSAPGQPGGYPQQGYHQQGPYQGQSGPGAPYAGGAGAPFGGSNGPGSGKKRAWLPIAVIAGALALILVIVLAVNSRNKGTDTTTSGGGSSSSTGESAGSNYGSSTEAVKAYFDALAAGKAQPVLDLSAEGVSDRTFLTDDILAASAKAAPITNLDIKETTSQYGSKQVVASYTIGGRSVSSSFYARQSGGTWTIDPVVRETGIYALASSPVTVKLAGQPVSKEMQLPIGRFPLTTDNDYYAVKPSTFTVESVSGSSSGDDPELVVSDKGLAAISAAAKAKVASCAKPGLMNDACGIEVRSTTYSGEKVDGKSMSCKVSSGLANLDKLKPNSLYSNATEVTIPVDMRYACTAKTTKGQTVTVNPSIFEIKADLSKHDAIGINFE